MAQQIKKKYIENNAVDGDKLKLLQDQSVRATDSLGNEVDLIKLSATDQVLVNDQEVALKSNLDAEITARSDADTAMQDSIDAEVIARSDADTSLQNQIDAINVAIGAVIWHTDKVTVDAAIATGTPVDLPHLIVAGSLVASVDRLMIHEGDDYTLSTVAGKTRVTFIGDFMGGGEQNLSVGDHLYFKYQYSQ